MGIESINNEQALSAVENSSRAMIFFPTIHLLFFSKTNCYSSDVVLSTAVATPQILCSVLSPSLYKDIEVLECIQRSGGTGA